MTDARCTEALAGLAALEKDAAMVAALAAAWGWTEAQPGGLLASPRKLSGGIIDCAFGTDDWFVIFNNDEIHRETQEGFSSRHEAVTYAMIEILAFLCDCLPE